MATDHAFSKDFSVLGGLTFFSKSIENKLVRRSEIGRNRYFFIIT